MIRKVTLQHLVRWTQVKNSINTKNKLKSKTDLHSGNAKVLQDTSRMRLYQSISFDISERIANVYGSGRKQIITKLKFRIIVKHWVADEELRN